MSRGISKPQFALAVLKSRRVELASLLPHTETGDTSVYVGKVIKQRIAEIDGEIASIYKKIEESKNDLQK